MRVAMTVEIETDDESRVSASRLSNYILRAIAGVVGNNKAKVLHYQYFEEEKDQTGGRLHGKEFPIRA
jgi:hypothetical protein